MSFLESILGASSDSRSKSRASSLATGALMSRSSEHTITENDSLGAATASDSAGLTIEDIVHGNFPTVSLPISIGGQSSDDNTSNMVITQFEVDQA
jgi:hypothetical protein